jgi:hypothetical protein
VLKSQIALHLWKTQDDEVDTNTAWESVRENIKISAKDNLGCL